MGQTPSKLEKRGGLPPFDKDWLPAPTVNIILSDERLGVFPWKTKNKIATSITLVKCTTGKLSHCNTPRVRNKRYRACK